MSSIYETAEGFVTVELERLRIEVGGRFQRGVRWLLQKPFYFQLVASRTVSLPKEAHPKDFYQTFFRGLTSSFHERFALSLLSMMSGR
jgi:hypothetical protein